MKTTTLPFDLVAWRHRMGAARGLEGALYQREAAAELGLSEKGYQRAELRAQRRPGSPVNATIVKLATLLEQCVELQAALIELDALAKLSETKPAGSFACPPALVAALVEVAQAGRAMGSISFNGDEAIVFCSELKVLGDALRRLDEVCEEMGKS